MSRLITEESVIDVLKQTGIIQDNDLGHCVIDEIKRIPTAYDKEEVIEWLESERHILVGKQIIETDTITIDRAIERVKAGGIDGQIDRR